MQARVATVLKRRKPAFDCSLDEESPIAPVGYSHRQACEVKRQHRSTQRKPSTRDPRTKVRQRMHEIVATRIRYGYRRTHVMLNREGCEDLVAPPRAGSGLHYIGTVVAHVFAPYPRVRSVQLVLEEIVALFVTGNIGVIGLDSSRGRIL